MSRVAKIVAIATVAASLLAGCRGRISEADANRDPKVRGAAARILACFHPLGVFDRLTAIDYDAPAAGYTADTTIRYRGALTGNAYSMDVRIESRRVDGVEELRETPGADSAPLPPHGNCRFRSWTPADSI